MALLPNSLAIGWAHYRLVGGWLQMGIVALAYMMVLAGGIVLSATVMDSTFRIQTLEAWQVGLLLFQCGTAVLFGVFRTGAAIRHDVSTRMMESHRLMPINGMQAMAGYLLGGTAQVWVTMAANVVLAMGLCAVGAGNPVRVLTAHVLVIAFGVMCWTAVALWSYVTRFVLALLVVLAIGLVVLGAVILGFVPGATVLCGPMIGNTAFGGLSNVGFVEAPLARAGSMLLQGAVAALYFFAAARKYNAPEEPGFNPLLGVAFLLVWIVATGVGLVFTDSYVWTNFSGQEGDTARTVLGIFSTLLVALVPISAAARVATSVRATRAAGFPVRAWHMVVPGVTLLVSVGAVALLLMVLPLSTWGHTPDWSGVYGFMAGRGDRRADWVWQWIIGSGLTMLVAASFLAFCYYGLRMLYRFPKVMTAPILLGWILVSCGGPFVLDFVRYLAMGATGDGVEYISGLSPAGALVLLWRVEETKAFSPVYAMPGVVGQGLAALMMMGLFYVTQKKLPAAKEAGAAEPVKIAA